MTEADLRDLFAQTGCQASLRVIDVDNDGEVSLDADEPGVSALIMGLA